MIRASFPISTSKLLINSCDRYSKHLTSWMYRDPVRQNTTPISRTSPSASSPQFHDRQQIITPQIRIIRTSHQHNDNDRSYPPLAGSLFDVDREFRQFAEEEEEERERQRSGSPFSRRTPSFWLMGLIVALNLLIFLLWQQPDLRNFMMEHFTMTKSKVMGSKPYVMISCIFSHAMLPHLLGNMLSLIIFGIPVYMFIGPARFSMLYLGAGIAGSIASLLSRRNAPDFFLVEVDRPRTREKPPETIEEIFEDLLQPFEPQIIRVPGDVPAMGASGAVMGVAAVVGITFPRLPIFLFGLPMPAGALVAFYVLYDWVSLHTMQKPGLGGTDHAAHLGGVVFGILYYIAVVRSMKKRMLSPHRQAPFRW